LQGRRNPPGLLVVVWQINRGGFVILDMATVIEEMMGPDLKGIAVLEHLLADALAVYFGSVGALQILDEEVEMVIQIIVGLTLNPGMVATDGRIIQLNGIIGVASDADLFLIQFVGTERHTFVF